MEDYAYILDYLPQGHQVPRRFKREPLAIALGDTEFKLLELIPKPQVPLQIGDRVYIGKDLEKRNEILHVKRRISHTDLTAASQSELPFIVEEIVKKDEVRFVKFFNEAQSISTRFHMLELIPGLGKKTMWSIIEERKKAPFKSYEDLAERVTTIHQPEKLICKRIDLELSDTSQKYRLFVVK